MADPVSMLAVGTMVAGTAVSVAGQLAQGDAAEAMAKRQAELERRQGVQRERLIRKQGERAKGRLRAAVGKSGVTMEGSPMEALAESAMNIEMDALNARYGASEAATMALAQGDAQKSAAQLGAATSLLSGAGQTAFTGRQLGAF